MSGAIALTLERAIHIDGTGRATTERAHPEARHALHMLRVAYEADILGRDMFTAFEIGQKLAVFVETGGADVTETLSRADHEKAVKAWTEEAFAADPVGMDEAFEAIFGVSVKAWQTMSRAQLHALGRVALRICLAARG